MLDTIQAGLTNPISWLAFTFGAIVGSFLNVCIIRVPERTFWKSHRSACPHCNAPIPFYLNIPIFSYLILRGKTACCHHKLSIQYPIVEFLTGCLALILYLKFPFLAGTDFSQIDHGNVLRFSHAFVFACILLVCSVIDIHHMIIPDVISLPTIALTPVIIYLHPELDWISGLLGVVAGGGILYAVAWLYWIIRREVGMGMGDVKLLAGIGGWLGYQSILPTVFYGSITGSIIGIVMIGLNRKGMSLKTSIPFGPFLALGALAHLIAGNHIVRLLVGQ